MMRHLLVLPLLAAALLWATTSRAAPLEVEVIVFARTISADSVDEAWPDRQQIQSFDSAGLALGRYPWVPCTTPGITCKLSPVPDQIDPVITSANVEPQPDNGIRLLAADQLKLADARSKLANQGNYRVLLHTGWQQAVADSRTTALPVRLIAGRNYGPQFGDDGYQLATTPPPKPTTDLVGDLQAEAAAELGQPLTTGPTPRWELDGTLSLYNSGALVVETSLQWRQPGTVPVRDTGAANSTATTSGSDTLSSSAVKVEGDVQVLAVGDETSNNIPTHNSEPFLFAYPLAQLRPLKKGETYYLDHPLYGVIVQVRDGVEAAPAAAPAAP